MSYDSNSIKVLDGLSHVRLNPNMYISTTDNPCHLIEEAFDNALDEAIAGYANIIGIVINSTSKKCQILDNGRGIPIDKDIPKTISTELFSGGKFKGKKDAYKISAGTHGIGLVAIFALSKYYAIEIYRDNRHVQYEKKNDDLIITLDEEFESSNIPFSTKIEFIADEQYFNDIFPDIERIRNRMITASVELQNVKFVLKIDDQTEVIHYNLEDFFTKEILNDNTDNITDIVTISSKCESESLSVTFCYDLDGNVTPKYMSSVNILPVKNGGNHITYLNDIFKNYFISKSKKEYQFNPTDVLTGLRCYVSLYIVDPKLKGQSKESLESTKKDLNHLLSDFHKQFVQFFNNNDEYTKCLLEHFHNYRKKINMRKIKSSSSNKGRGLKKFTKLRDCQSRKGELFIVEGDSAAGGIIQARDPNKIAVLPLKGKIASFTNKKNILENKEIGEMIQAFGTGIEPDFNMNNFRYDKIICCCDADADGGHIATLLTMNIALLTPEIIKQGHYYIAHTPLYAINEKRVFIPLWTPEELEQAIKENRKITRYKGLGELNTSDLKTCLLNEKTRKLFQVQWTDKLDKLISLLNNVTDKRKLLKGDF